MNARTRNCPSQAGMGSGSPKSSWSATMTDPVVRYMSGSSWDDEGILQMGEGGPTHDEHANLLGEDLRQGQPHSAQTAAAMKLGLVEDLVQI